MAAKEDEIRHRLSSANPTTTTESETTSNQQNNPPIYSWNCWTNSGPSEMSYRTNLEYVEALRQWMWACHSLNAANMGYMSHCYNMINVASMQQNQPIGSAGNEFQLPNRAPRPSRTQNNQTAQGTEYQIPAVWKRVVAEFIDFLLLFLLKLAATLFIIEYVGVLDVEKYEIHFENLFRQDMDYNEALIVTQELVMLELVNRICICIFETMCLRRGIGRAGGATPGKRIMGLTVVSCERIIDLAGNKVRVFPAQDIGLWNAFTRSFLKNFSLTFFFPICFSVFIFDHSRALYDQLSNCLVVEEVDTQ